MDACGDPFILVSVYLNQNHMDALAVVNKQLYQTIQDLQSNEFFWHKCAEHRTRLNLPVRLMSGWKELGQLLSLEQGNVLNDLFVLQCIPVIKLYFDTYPDHFNKTLVMSAVQLGYDKVVGLLLEYKQPRNWLVETDTLALVKDPETALVLLEAHKGNGLNAEDLDLLCGLAALHNCKPLMQTIVSDFGHRPYVYALVDACIGYVVVTNVDNVHGHSEPLGYQEWKHILDPDRKILLTTLMRTFNSKHASQVLRLVLAEALDRVANQPLVLELLITVPVDLDIITSVLQDARFKTEMLQVYGLLLAARNPEVRKVYDTLFKVDNTCLPLFMASFLGRVKSKHFTILQTEYHLDLSPYYNEIIDSALRNGDAVLFKEYCLLNNTSRDKLAEYTQIAVNGYNHVIIAPIVAMGGVIDDDTATSMLVRRLTEPQFFKGDANILLDNGFRSTAIKSCINHSNKEAWLYILGKDLTIEECASLDKDVPVIECLSSNGKDIKSMLDRVASDKNKGYRYCMLHLLLRHGSVKAAISVPELLKYSAIKNSTK